MLPEAQRDWSSQKRSTGSFARSKVVLRIHGHAGPAARARVVRRTGLHLDMMDTSFFLGRETRLSQAGSSGNGLPWRERLFVSMYRNATDAAN